MPSRRKSQPWGASSAVSSSPFRTRGKAFVRALTAREIVGRHTLNCSPITAYITLWRMRISAALRESLNPGLGGRPSAPSSRRRMSRSANLAVGSPVVYPHDDGPFLMRLLTLFAGHHTSWGRAIIISIHGNATRHPLNNLRCPGCPGACVLEPGFCTPGSGKFPGGFVRGSGLGLWSWLWWGGVVRVGVCVS